MICEKMTINQPQSQQSFHFMTGKGGVGKTTISMLLGICFSQRDQKKTLICEVDQKEEICRYFRQKESRGEIRECAHLLSTVNISFDQALAEYGVMKLKFKSIYHLFFDHPLVKALIALVPGVEDLVLLGKAFNHHREVDSKQQKIWQKVILDAPASGHADTLLELPRVIKDAVPYGNLHQEAQEMWDLIHQPKQTKIHLVCLLEALAVQELIEFNHKLKQKELSSQTCIWINCFDPHQEWDIPMLNRLKQDFQALMAVSPKSSQTVLLKWFQIEILNQINRIDLFFKLIEAFTTKIDQDIDQDIYYLPKFKSTSLSEFKKYLNLDELRISETLIKQAKNYQEALVHLQSQLSQIQMSLLAQVAMPTLSHQTTTKIRKKLKIVMGGGGVGKTTCSVSLALQAQKRGLKTALITIDPAKRLAQALGLSELSSSLKPLAKYPLIDAMMLDRKDSSDLLVKQLAKTPQIAESILSNRYYQAFSTHLAGTQEYMAIYEVCMALQKDYDLLILDTPPSKHAFDFLDAPHRLLQSLNQSTMLQILSPQKSKSSMFSGMIIKSLSKMTAGPFLEELFQFISLFRDILEGLKANAQQITQTLHEDTTVILVSSTADESIVLMSEMLTELKKRKIQIETLLLNRFQSNEQLTTLKALALEDPSSILTKLLSQKIKAIEFDQAQLLKLQNRLNQNLAIGNLTIMSLNEVNQEDQMDQYLSSLLNDLLLA
jgi:anion-transporting  ArsA/GET3 family ATPase